MVKDLAIEHGACIRPIQLRRTNLDTGEADTVLVPCGHTLAHVCPSCAERAKTLRAAQCWEGWHLEDEPGIAPDPATDDQKYPRLLPAKLCTNWGSGWTRRALDHCCTLLLHQDQQESFR